MADTSRKRSRKSKLVPRECLMDEDDLELQVPATKIPKNMKQMMTDIKKTNKSEATTSLFKSTATSLVATTSNLETPSCDTSVLRKINASARNSIELDKTSPRKFEINIEVESCEDEDDFIEELTENKEGNSTAKKDAGEKSGSFLKAEEEKQRTVIPRPIQLDLEGILKAVDKLQTSENIANRILSIYIRNTIGYEQKSKLEFGWLENQIQAALDVWRDWQSRSFHRGEPLFYKCYICTKSYWYLSDFRSHLFSTHGDDNKLYISVERYEIHESNLIAYHRELMVIQDIYAPGRCYRCGRDYAAHKIISRYQERYYKEPFCPRYFFCCTGLIGHFPSCSICKVQTKPLKCQVCKTGLDTDEELMDHLVLSHSVRSDIPILKHYTNSQSIELEQYENKYLHNCAKNVLGKNADCVHSLLTLKDTIESPMKRLIEPYRCEICEQVMLYSCMKYEHMLSHTDEFMIVKKCTACEGLNVFVNKAEAKAHWNLKHKNMNLKREQNNFHRIFVPWSCVYQSLAKFDLKEQESAVVEQESTTEVKESISEVKESISEVLQSVADEQESDVDEKPSLFEIDEAAVSALCRFESSDFKIEETVVKEEPQDFEESTALVIKEEPLEEADDQTFEEESETQNFDEQTQVKQEVDEEIDEYDDLIKLDFNLEDLLVKEESGEVDEETQDSENEYLDNISEEASQDSMLEPKVVLTERKRRVKKIYKCTCGFQSTHKEYRKHLKYNCIKHVIKTKDLNCTKCGNHFNSMKKYLNHFEEHGYPRMSCPECLKLFENFSNLGQHVQKHVRQSFVRVKMITHAGESMVKPENQCTKCAARIDYEDFFDHWETHIKGKPSLPVDVNYKAKNKEVKCGQLKESEIKECIARLHITTKQCNVCLRYFNRVNECKRHIIEHMLLDAYTQKHIYKELRCQICETGFALSDKYKKHMRDHASLPVYKCELCDRTFSDSSNFTKHKKVHNLKVIICDLCGKKFQSKMSLEKHIEHHRNTAPIPCKICNKVFYFESSHRRHVRSYHEKPASEYRCVICGNRFPSLKLKWDHMWEVHEERKQKADCPICHKSFRKYSDVRAHAKSVHMRSITVISIKCGKPQAAEKKHDVNTSKFYNSSWPKLAVRPEKETLIVYDSD